MVQNKSNWPSILPSFMLQSVSRNLWLSKLWLSKALAESPLISCLTYLALPDESEANVASRVWYIAKNKPVKEKFVSFGVYFCLKAFTKFNIVLSVSLFSFGVLNFYVGSAAYISGILAGAWRKLE